MYPLFRTTKELWINRKADPLPIGQDHVTHLMAWPWDIDIFLDLNNGRVLTLFDLGRLGLFQRMGVLTALKSHGWYGTVAGTAIRYRKRITMFQRLELRTRIVGWDDRFTYFEQAFWRGDDCAAHAVIRTAITSGKGIVPTEEVARALGLPNESPELPDWIKQWSQAEGLRNWPPERR
ncbi:MAG: acyl-CoA thioesterase, partial [Ruegeria sp.]|nr:acyl-CoA thioesterase [Ruegeria sp.]